MYRAIPSLRRSLSSARPPLPPPLGPTQSRQAQPQPGGARGGPPPPPTRPQGILDLNGRVITSAPPKRPIPAPTPSPSSTSGSSGPPSPPLEPVVDVNQGNFQALVLNCPVAVILQATAGWCEPCKKLSPVLERAARASKGVLVYARLDVDAEPELAGQLGIRSLPTVFGIVKGKAVDTFQGLPDDTRMRGFFEALIGAAEAAGAMPSGAAGGTGGSPLDGATRALGEAVQAIDEGRVGEAEAPLRSLLASLQALEARFWEEQEKQQEQQPGSAAPAPPSPSTPRGLKRKLVNPVPKEIQELAALTRAALIRLCCGLVQQGGRAQGGALTEKEFALGVEAAGHAGALRESYKSHLGLPQVGRALGIEAALGTSLGALRLAPLESHRAGVAAAPKDASAHLRLAQALLGVGSGVEAMEVGLEGLRLAKTGGGKGSSSGVGGGGGGGEDVVGATRACVLAAFEVLGPEHERVVAGRKALSKLLF